MARLILDTGVLVATARGLLDESEVTEDDDVALPAVAVAEYLAGVLLDTDPARRTLLSTDFRARFNDLPGVTARLITI